MITAVQSQAGWAARNPFAAIHDGIGSHGRLT